jgi:hypothetical protein
MRKYFYKLLSKYLLVYIRPNDKMLELDALSNDLTLNFSGSVNAKLDAITTEKLDADYVVLNGILHYESDIQGYLEKLHAKMSPNSRLIVTYYSSLWKPFLYLATLLKLRRKTPESNWLAHEDIANLLYVANFESIKIEPKILIPVYIPIISDLINRYLAPLPFFRLFSMINILIARPIGHQAIVAEPSVSIVVAARNEEGNLESILRRLPKMGMHDEIIFVEGGSNDNTWKKLQEIAQTYKDKINIQIAQQDGKGKGDAVRKGFSMARNEILMILDADMTVAPEDLPKFYRAITAGKGEFINGSRLVYPMEKRAMRFFNLLANKFFAMAFSFVLGQRFKDTLCGTKVISRKHYEKLVSHRAYFGDFDPFGDFDLIFGAARMGLKIVEIPIVYQERTYGETNISRWTHGLLLLRMLIFASRRFKFL